MSSLSKGIWSSLIFHALIVIVIVSISTYVPIRKIMQIDFSIENSSGIPNRDHEPAPKLKKQEMTRPIQKEEKFQPRVKDEEKVIQNSAVSSVVSEDQAPVTAPAVQQESHNNLPTVKDVVSTRSEPVSAGKSIESEKQRYLKEHFKYIRDLIQKKLTYPNIARRMGWTGKVVIAFVICTDGNVKDIKITESSGFEILDKNTIEIVKNTSPFPRPPVEAQLLIPVSYSLN